MIQLMHYPVMVKNVLKNISQLNLSRKILIADCNFGLGGHSNAILKSFPNSFIKGYDLDQRIIQKYKNSQSIEKGDQSRLSLINDNYTQILNSNLKFDVILADLGFNSLQLEEVEGFSWNKDSNLNMRYSTRGQTCSQLIERLTYIELVDILVKYGDLNTTEAKLAAGKIVQSKPIKTTFQLRDCIVGCFQSNKTRKIAQVFQSLRIAVNKQLQSLKKLCMGMDQNLNKNGLVMLITFHSLERNLIYTQVKQKEKLYSKIKNEKPSKEQLAQNRRSKSAQMLIFKKI